MILPDTNNRMLNDTIMKIVKSPYKMDYFDDYFNVHFIYTHLILLIEYYGKTKL